MRFLLRVRFLLMLYVWMCAFQSLSGQLIETQPTLLHIEAFSDQKDRITVDLLFNTQPQDPSMIWAAESPDLHVYFEASFASWLVAHQVLHQGPLHAISLVTEPQSLVLHMTSQTDYQVQIKDHHMLIMFHAAAPEKGSFRPSPRTENQVYQGHRMSLNVKNMPMKEALALVALQGSMNLILSDSVQGSLTLNVEDQPWDALFDLILASHHLTKKVVQGTTIVMTREQAMDDMESINVPVRAQAVQKKTEVIFLNYAKVDRMSELLQDKKMHLLSKEGALSFDHRLNALIIHDVPRCIERIKTVVAQLDVPISQVVIEARVVTMRDHIAEDLGVRWGYSAVTSQHKTSGSLDAIHAEPGSAKLEDTLNFNAPALSHHGTPFKVGMQWQKLAGQHLIDLELSALEQERQVEILASPSITTVNHQKASIEQGTEIPYVESASSGATSVVFKKAALSLEVTPQILPQQQILLDLKVKQDHQGDTVSTSTGQAVAIDMQRMSSKILLKNHETLVIGGIYQTKHLTSVRKVPWLGDLPYLGVLFRSTEVFSERHEVLIFVTPKLM